MAVPKLSLLSPVNFTFSISQLPNVNYHLNAVNLPGVTSTALAIPTPLNPVYTSDMTFEQEELNITFKVDEEMSNWLEIYNWMLGISMPTSSTQRTLLVESGQFDKNLASTGLLTIYTNSKNPQFTFVFDNLFPLSVGNIEFSTNTSETEVECSASFRYDSYSLKTA